MRSDTTVFLRSCDKIVFRPQKSGGCIIHIEDAQMAGSDLRISFCSMEQAERFADAIYYAKMDRDADAIQNVELVAQ